MEDSPAATPPRKRAKQTNVQKRRARQSRLRQAIVTSEVLHEVWIKGHQTVRLTRLTYKDAGGPFIDIRVFSRGYDKQGQEQLHPTRQGIHLWESDFDRLVESQFFGALNQAIGQDPR